MNYDIYIAKFLKTWLVKITAVSLQLAQIRVYKARKALKSKKRKGKGKRNDNERKKSLATVFWFYIVSFRRKKAKNSLRATWFSKTQLIWLAGKLAEIPIKFGFTTQQTVNLYH